MPARRSGAGADQPTRPLHAPSGPRSPVSVGTILGHYELLREVARGASGVVYEARDVTLGRTLALKVLDVEVGEAVQVQRLRREAELAARLRHPHIITVHQVGEARLSTEGPPVHFIAMDYVAGDTLHAAARRLDRDAQVELLRQVAEAVGHAHAQGVIHRDLKPTNVLLTKEGRAVVTDFGLARSAEDIRLTHTGQRLGTPLYMAPEQVAGTPQAIDARADVWALGVMLYEALTGRRPFRGDSIETVYHRVLLADPLPPRQLNPQVPRALEAVCLKALARDPAERYATASEVADELVRWQRGESVEARSLSVLGRLTRRVRRRSAVGAGVLIVLALILPVLAYGGWRWQRNRQRQALAMQARAAVDRKDWSAALAACRAALDLGPDATLLELSGRCASALAAADAAARRRSIAAGADRALVEQLQHVRRQIREVRPLLYRVGSDAPGALGRLASALEALEPKAVEAGARLGELWALVGAGWALVGWDDRALSALQKAVALRPDDGWVRRDLARICLRRAFGELLISTPAGRRTEPSRAWTTAASRHLGADTGDWAGARPVDRHLARCHAALAAGEHAVLRRLCREGRSRFDGEPGAQEYWTLMGWIERDASRRLGEWEAALERKPHDAWVLVLRATTYLDLGRAAEARADLDEALRINPHLTLGYVQRAGLHEQAGDLAAAEGDLDRAIASAPGYAVAYCNRAAIRDRRGSVGAALEDYERALALDPRQPMALFNRGLRWVKSGRWARALADFDLAAEQAPGWVDVHLERGRALRALKRTSEARQAYEDAIRVGPREPKAYFMRAVMHEERGDRPAAIADYSRAIEVGPQYGPAFHNRGSLRRVSRDLPGAREDLERAVELMPSHAPALQNLGFVYFSLRRMKDTIRVMNRALALEPDDARSYAFRGAARLDQAQLGGAVEDLSRAIRLDPTLSMAYFFRGFAHGHAGRIDQALADYGRAIELDPKDWQPAFQRAILRRRQGQMKEALVDLERVIRHAPGHPDGYFERSLVHRAAGRGAAATADLQRVLELDPNHDRALFYRGVDHMAAGRHRPAAADFGAVARLVPGHWLALSYLGSALWKTGEKAAAIRAYRRALSSAPPERRARIQSWLDTHANDR